ncbi:MAG: hypothetical protein SFV51_17010 [Bryobacteraceae bacterium]|nr:hypothetical protein [Bryobacteraceae bacterium]
MMNNRVWTMPAALLLVAAATAGQTIESEVMVGSGTIVPRAAASGLQTRRVSPGAVVSGTFSVQAAGSYEITMTCSNDSYAGLPLEQLSVTVDGVPMRQTAACPNTAVAGQPGAGWNVFRTVSFGTTNLGVGSHTLVARVLDPTDGYQLELDKFATSLVSVPAAGVSVEVVAGLVQNFPASSSTVFTAAASCTAAYPVRVGGGCVVNNAQRFRLSTSAPSGGADWVCHWSRESTSYIGQGQAFAICAKK